VTTCIDFFVMRHCCELVTRPTRVSREQGPRRVGLRTAADFAKVKATAALPTGLRLADALPLA